MRRREFIAMGLACGWSLPCFGDTHRLPTLAILMPQNSDDAVGRSRIGTVVSELGRLGWEDRRNLRVSVWWGANGRDARQVAQQALKITPRVIFAGGTGPLSGVAEVTKEIPIVFAQVSDPVGAGFVASAARPGGNITGFTDYEYTFGLKWLELIASIAPHLRTVGVVYDPTNPVAPKFLPYIEAEASSQGIAFHRIPIYDAIDIENGIEEFATRENGGLIILAGSTPLQHRELICSMALRFSLPAVYPYRAFAEAGGLLSYGIDVLAMYRGAASYIARILDGEKPQNLPVQFGTKFELVVNTRTAALQRVRLPMDLLVRADDVFI